MIEFLNDIDSQVLIFFNSLHTSWLDDFMMMFTGRLVWVPMYATILYILFSAFSVRKAVVLTLGIVLAIVFADQVCATLLRPFFERLRPANPENPLSQFVHVVDGYRGGSYGFPSCHGSNSFALATILALTIRNRRFTFFIFLWAAMNAYTRLYLGVHYPGDLIVGAMIGSLGAWGIYTILSRLVDLSPRNERLEILFSAPAGRLGTAVGLNVLKVRTFDIMTAVGITTMFILFVIALV